MRCVLSCSLGPDFGQPLHIRLVAVAISAALARPSAMHVRLQTHEQRCLVALPRLQLKPAGHRCVAACKQRQQWSSQVPNQLVNAMTTTAVLQLALVHALEVNSWPVCRRCIAPPATMTAEPLKQGWTALITGATGIQVSRYAAELQRSLLEDQPVRTRVMVIVLELLHQSR